MNKFPADTILDRVNRTYKFIDKYTIRSPKCLYKYTYDGWAIEPARGDANRLEEYRNATSDTHFKTLYFGTAEPGGVFVTPQGCIPYESFTRTNLRKIYGYITGEVLGKVLEIAEFFTKNRDNDLATFIRYCEMVENFMRKYDYDFRKVTESIDNFKNIPPHFKNDGGALYESVFYYIRSCILDSGCVYPQNEDGVAYSIHKRFQHHFNCDIIDPWTQKVRKAQKLNQHGMFTKVYTLAEIKRLPEQAAKQRPVRPVAKLRPVRELIKWKGVNMGTMYPPMPIISGLDKPIRRDDTKSDVGTYLFMGVELELNYAGPGNIPGLDNDRIRASHAIMKTNKDVRNIFHTISSKWQVLPHHDGTVSGPEFVSSPGTLNAHSIMWYDILGMLQESNLFDVDINAGIHIHVNREVFTPIAFGKVYRFINQKANNNFINKLCGRPMSEQCVRKETSFGHSLVEAQTKRVAVSNYKDSTIEFRLFKSTLDYTRFMSYLEFVSALINWIYEDLPSLQNMTTDLFAQYVKRYRRTYYNLAAILVLEGLL